MTKLDGMFDPKLLNAVRKLQGKPWKTTYVAIKSYRKALLKAQGDVCIYCRRPIYRDEAGFREIDHVLPKSRSPADNADFLVSPYRSNALLNRRNTVGYPEFQYEPLNLVASCKRCNSHKGTFDGLADRSVSPLAYLGLSRDYEWIHPHFDHYNLHIDVAAGMIYKPVAGSSKGKAVIHACGLEKAEELMARMIDAYVFPYEELRNAMNAAVVGRDRHLIDYSKLAVELHGHYKVGTVHEIEALLFELYNEVKTNSSIHLGKILETIGPRLGATGAITPAPLVKSPIKVATKLRRRKHN